MDISVLERQSAMFRRLYQHSPQLAQNNVNNLQSAPMYPLHNMVVNENPMLVKENSKIDQCFNENLQNLAAYGAGENLMGFAASCDVVKSCFEMDHLSFTTISDSSLTRTTKVEDHGAKLADKEKKSSTKKRKAEDEMEDYSKDKRIEGEAGEEQSEITVKSEGENSNENSKASEVKKPDYIHVRARRGQATDSHSLAERARREKISKKMKYLQDLVPGCNKVTGKAGMLDEIINYVQSLQKQVEFLSMKLATLNPRLDFNIDNLFAKELPAYMASFPAPSAPVDMVNSSYLQLNPLQQAITSCGVDIAMNGTQMTPQRRDTSSMSIPQVYINSSSVPQAQQLQTWDTDWQSHYNSVNFH